MAGSGGYPEQGQGGYGGGHGARPVAVSFASARIPRPMLPSNKRITSSKHICWQTKLAARF
jgi:hypothetical protein